MRRTAWRRQPLRSAAASRRRRGGFGCGREAALCGMKALFAKGDGKVLSDASRRSEGTGPTSVACPAAVAPRGREPTGLRAARASGWAGWDRQGGGDRSDVSGRTVTVRRASGLRLPATPAGPAVGPRRSGAPGEPGCAARSGDRRSLRGSACAHHSADRRGRRRRRRGGANRPNASAASAGARAWPLGAVVMLAIAEAPPPSRRSACRVPQKRSYPAAWRSAPAQPPRRAAQLAAGSHETRRILQPCGA